MAPRYPAFRFAGSAAFEKLKHRETHWSPKEDVPAGFLDPTDGIRPQARPLRNSSLHRPVSNEADSVVLLGGCLRGHARKARR